MEKTYNNQELTFKQRAKVLVSQMNIEEKISQMIYNASAIERLGIPAYNWWNECLHGVARSGKATVFPQAIAMAASFNTELVKKVGEAISDEARAKYNEYKKFGDTLIYQGLTFWSPNINIFRDPRWGRGHETYGEDPFLTSEMGIAFVKGLQGGGKHRKVDATLKHYAVHSGPEDDRHGFNVNIDDYTLYNTYLYAFKRCIEEAKPAAVMTAYNGVNEEPCSASPKMIGDILYDEFKFDGYVVSDCGAICDINEYFHITKNKAESAAMAVNSGCNLNCGTAYPALKTAVANGLVSEEKITDAVEKLFTARFQLGMFDECEYDNIPFDVVECNKHKKLSLDLAKEGIVLLKNNGILPIKENKKVAVIGPNADDKNILLGNYNGTPTEYTTILKGLLKMQDSHRIIVDYARGCDTIRPASGYWEEQPLREAILCAQRADIVILCMGINPLIEGEEADEFSPSLSGDKKDLELPAVQKELYREIMKLKKPTVFINVSGSCINLKQQDTECDAVVQCFYPGASGGNAMAQILMGEDSPSGRLPVTFYESVDDLPDFEDYTMENMTYKYYNGVPVYPFGHGLSYSNLTEKWIGENRVKLTNNGEYDTMYSILKYSCKEPHALEGFKKIYIKAGEVLVIEFE